MCSRPFLEDWINLCNIATEPYYYMYLIFTSEPTHTTSKQWHCIPHLCIYHQKRRYFVASYVQPIMQQNESTTNFCNQSSYYENYKWFTLGIEAITCLPQNRHFFCGEQRWMGHKGGPLVSPWRIHFMYTGYLLGWSNIKQRKNQACSLSHCQVTQVWRHQSVRQLVS